MPHDSARFEQSASSVARARACALKLLQTRQLSEATLTHKLEAQGFLPEVVRQAVSECRSWGYAHDGRLVEAWSHTANRRGKGPAWLRAKLLGDGICDQKVQDVLKHHHAGEKSQAQQLLARRFGALAIGRDKEARRQQARAARFLAGRGFSAEAIGHALGAAISGALEGAEP